MPAVIHSDQGREFENNMMQELCLLGGSHKTRTLLSLINSIPSGDSGERQSSSSLVASVDLDGDVGLLTSLLSPPSVGSMTRASDFSF